MRSKKNLPFLFHNDYAQKTPTVSIKAARKACGIPMFKRVLVATDFSRHASRVLDCIGGIPGMEEIVLVHVPEGTMPPEETGQKLQGLAAGLSSLKVPVRPVILTGKAGDTAGVIARAAVQERASLVVTGAKGRNFLRTLVLGSVSRGVIEAAPTDVLVLHFRGEDAPGPGTMDLFCRHIFHRVLCPVDFSRPTEDMMAFVAGLPFIREVVLLHVLPGPTQSAGPDAPEYRSAMARLEELRGRAGVPAERVRVLVRYGDPAAVTAACAQETDASLVLVSRYGKCDYATSIPLGKTAAGIAERSERPVYIRYPRLHLDVVTRELSPREFVHAEQVWIGYRGQKADPATDRVFAVFVEGKPAAAARCRRHPDGLEVDGVFVPEEYRNRGYARRAVQALVAACGKEALYMHSTPALTGFYGSFKFLPIPESGLPEHIRERFDFAGGNLAGAGAVPMMRPPG